MYSGAVRYSKYDELIQYLGRINDNVLHDLDYISTNHVLLNSVINVKYEEAVEHSILFICKINDLSGLTMNPSELVVLLSNLFNNAIEACKKCIGERKIKLMKKMNEKILGVKGINKSFFKGTKISNDSRLQ